MTRKGLGLRLAITTTTVGASLLFSNPGGAQIPPPAKKAARVEITNGPDVELSKSHLTIIRWTTNNPGGSDVHYGVVLYGTDPKELSEMAKNPITLNQNHPETTFRVQMRGLEPRTTYYYTVTSMESNGKSDGVKSEVHQFTTP
jgi:phosphodiesterase/alkaline phosphatase D-like protein